MSAGGGAYGSSGSFKVLEANLRACPKLLIGSETSGSYTRGSFLFLPKSEVFEIRQKKYLVASDDESVRNKARAFLEETPLADLLFQEKFSHLIMFSRIEVGLWPLFRKNYLIQYTSLPHELQDPQMIDPYIETILKLRKFFNV